MSIKCAFLTYNSIISINVYNYELIQSIYIYIDVIKKFCYCYRTNKSLKRTVVVLYGLQYNYIYLISIETV